MSGEGEDTRAGSSAQICTKTTKQSTLNGTITVMNRKKTLVHLRVMPQT